MPMNFPDMKSLIEAGRVHKFRAPDVQETEENYREALANHVASLDFVESEEIRSGKGWDRWDDSEKVDILRRWPSKS